MTVVKSVNCDVAMPVQGYVEISLGALQASSAPVVVHSQPAHQVNGPVSTAAPMPASPGLDSRGRQQDSTLRVNWHSASVAVHFHPTSYQSLSTSKICQMTHLVESPLLLLYGVVKCNCNVLGGPHKQD